MTFLTYGTGLIALGLLCLSSSSFAAVGLRTTRANLRARSLRLREQSQLRKESRHAHLASELSWQVAPDVPTAWRVVEVAEIVDESADCRSFYLRDPLGGALPEFLPGQFIMVRPALGGANLPTRCYSLSGAPGQPWWRITVKRQGNRPAEHNQANSLSVWLHQRIGVGDCLLSSAPCGEFVLERDATGPIVLLGAGIGVTPLVSMLKQSLQDDPVRPVHVFLQVQDADHWPLGETLHRWQQSCPALSVTTYFSREMPEFAENNSAFQTGKFDAQSVLDGIVDRDEAAFYLCGPNAWMATLVENLMAQGVDREQIHFESFGPAADNPSGAVEQSPKQPWSLSFARSGITVPASTQAATVWEAAADHGLQLPSGCHSGACGSCRVRMLSGQVKYRARPQCGLAEHEVLSCVAQPVGDVIIDA